jgi:predicted RNA-binding protein YlxR (DUF448 family)
MAMAEETGTSDARTRSCAVTRASRPTDELIRFVRAPDGTVVVDLRCRLPGRGVWVGGARGTVELAVRRKVFGRGFKAEVAVAPDLADQVEVQLSRELRESLALANKAGRVVTGFAKVEAALASGGVAVLVHARDAAPDGVRKMNAAATRHGGATVISPLDGACLDLALGRSNVVHAALLAGPLSEVVLARAARLGRYTDDRTAAGHGENDTGQPAGTDTQ